MAQTLEIVTFRLRVGHEAGFAAANVVVSDWLARQPGFVWRHLAYRKAGDWWVDTVLWESRAAAWTAAEKIMKELGETQAMRAIDPDSIDMSHADVVLAYPSQSFPVPANDAA